MWDKLSMKDRARVMKMAVESGITNLDIIKETYNNHVNKFEEGGDKRVNYYDPITGQSFGSTMPEGKTEVTDFRQLTPEAQDEYMRNREKTLDELVVTASPGFKPATLSEADRNFEDTFGISVKEAASWLPWIGDGIDIYDSTVDALDGNYTTAGMTALGLLLPNIIEKPLKKGYKYLKNFFSNDGDDVTKKVLKAVKNYGGKEPALYNVDVLREALKKEGVDISKLSDSDLRKLQAARTELILDNLPKDQRVSTVIHPNDNNLEVVRLHEDDDIIGTLSLTPKEDESYGIGMIQSSKRTKHKIGEDLYNSGIAYSRHRGKRGVVSGEELWSPQKTTKTLEHFPNKEVIGNYGEWSWPLSYRRDNPELKIFGNPVYLLSEPGERAVVPTRDLSIFSTDILDKDGFFLMPDWTNPRLDYKKGGKLHK